MTRYATTEVAAKSANRVCRIRSALHLRKKDRHLQRRTVGWLSRQSRRRSSEAIKSRATWHHFTGSARQSKQKRTVKGVDFETPRTFNSSAVLTALAIFPARARSCSFVRSYIQLVHSLHALLIRNQSALPSPASLCYALQFTRGELAAGFRVTRSRPNSTSAWEILRRRLARNLATRRFALTFGKRAHTAVGPHSRRRLGAMSDRNNALLAFPATL